MIWKLTFSIHGWYYFANRGPKNTAVIKCKQFKYVQTKANEIKACNTLVLSEEMANIDWVVIYRTQYGCGIKVATYGSVALVLVYMSNMECMMYGGHARYSVYTYHVCGCRIKVLY